MRNPHGQGTTTSRQTGKTIEEFDTLTCCHCNCWYAAPTAKTPLEEIGGFCQMCNSATCPKCCAKGTCTPFMKKLELQERRGRMLASILGE